MKNILLLLLTLCTIQVARAQNYQCVQHGPVHYFTNSDGYLRAIRIDSVKAVGADSVFYPFKTMRNWPISYCYADPVTPRGCWLGETLVKKPDGTFVISNIQNKDVTIKTLADVGEEWQFYTDSLGINYKAKVQSIDTMTVLGDVDTIKTILITAYLDTLPNPLDDVDGFSIIISKNHGLVRAFDFYTFPYHRPGILSVERHEFDYYLDVVTKEIWNVRCGGMDIFAHRVTISNSIFNLIPFRHPRNRDLYDFSAGDTLQYSNQYNWGTVSRNTRTALFYTSKTITPDKYRYTYSWEQKQTSSDYGVANPSTYGTGTNTGEYDTTQITSDNQLPEEWGNHSLLEYYPDSSYNGCPTIVYTFISSGINFSSRIVRLDPNGAGNTMLYLNFITYALGYGDIQVYNSRFRDFSEVNELTFASKSGVRCGIYGPVVLCL